MAQLGISVHSNINEIPAPDWDGCVGELPDDPGNPFISHRFLAALEVSGSVGRGTGWYPNHLIARQGGRVVGVAPCYLKTHSQGEYIFDHNWADAFQRAGGEYYPKLQCAVPFTPVSGPRLIAADPQIRRALLGAMQQLARSNGLSGAHVTFCTEAEAGLAGATDFLPRITQQYHWFNHGYADFDDFLAQLSSRKRKAIRKERARAQGFGGTIRSLRGDAIQPEHWQAFWRFYQDTGSRKWGRPYLTRDFFDQLHATMREDCLLVLAERDGRPVAGALNLIGGDALYGRYWGCDEDHPFLHFELCYHQAIDWAIAHGLTRVEAGAQGDHKLARGYMPAPTHSLHWVADPGFRGALQDYLAREREAISDEIIQIADWGPFRRG